MNDGNFDQANRDIPQELLDELTLSHQAASVFYGMSPSCKKETVQYVAEAKKPETRQRRAKKMIEGLLDGSIGGAR